MHNRRSGDPQTRAPRSSVLSHLGLQEQLLEIALSFVCCESCRVLPSGSTMSVYKEDWLGRQGHETRLVFLSIPILFFHCFFSFVVRLILLIYSSIRWTFSLSLLFVLDNSSFFLLFGTWLAESTYIFLFLFLFTTHILRHNTCAVRHINFIISSIFHLAPLHLHLHPRNR
jgi:hypothetical protein